MLSRLSIKNYALISELEASFSDGFTTITGETGAGKSILLGALSLVLGKRADLSSLMDKERKCIIEAEFEIGKYLMQSFFGDNDLDYEARTIVRREILPSGKSRAFINDSPVNLDILSRLGGSLVDVHSQHQTLRLTENDFQLKVIDALAHNADALKKYSQALMAYQKAQGELNELVAFQSNADKEHDYNSFLLKELESFPLQKGIQKELEEEQTQLSNAAEIISQLSKGNQLLRAEQVGISEQLAELKRIFQNLSGISSKYDTIRDRLESIFIELEDVAGEVESFSQEVELNPNRLDEVNGLLQVFYGLQKKHQVASIDELLKVKHDLALKVAATENIEVKLEAKKNEVIALEQALNEIANRIHEKRNSVIPKLKNMLQHDLISLGMPSATFKIEVNLSTTFKKNGKDDLVFLFSANKGSDFGALKKVASGGELSRIMLVIKSILADYEQLPTMMFDEIDTGVSGEISSRMGEIMQKMSSKMQVFAITHLPQVASKGAIQFKVFKDELNQMTHTKIKELTDDERIVELAEMLSGKAVSDSAMAHAKQLLQVSSN